MPRCGAVSVELLARWIACGLLLCAAAHTARAQPYFTGLGTLDGSAVVAWDVSPDGQVISGDTGIFGKQVALWTHEGGWRAITSGTPADTTGGISSFGRVVIGGFPGGGTRHAFRWTEATGAVSIGDLPGGLFRSAAHSTTPRGDIIAGYSNSANGNEAVLWTANSGLVPLGDLPGGSFASAGQKISADGKVIVGNATSTSGTEAFRWTVETGMVGLGDLDGGPFESIATAVSADGSVIVGDGTAPGPRTFRWTEQTGMIALDKVHPDQSTQRAYATSWGGDVIVGEVIVSGVGAGPFYWTPDGSTRWLVEVLSESGVIVPEGWVLWRANAVSADGRTIVGNGVNPDGEGEAWIAYLGPACRADYDEDGSVNTADVIAYLGAWSQRSIFADWNYDGSIDTRDVIGFLGEWVAKPGCG